MVAIMKNKVLIQLNVPVLNESFDIFIPTNERIGIVIQLLLKNISELAGELIILSDNCALLNQDTASIYDKESIVRDTDIKNATKLVLM